MRPAAAAYPSKLSAGGGSERQTSIDPLRLPPSAYRLLRQNKKPLFRAAHVRGTCVGEITRSRLCQETDPPANPPRRPGNPVGRSAIRGDSPPPLDVVHARYAIAWANSVADRPEVVGSRLRFIPVSPGSNKWTRRRSTWTFTSDPTCSPDAISPAGASTRATTLL